MTDDTRTPEPLSGFELRDGWWAHTGDTLTGGHHTVVLIRYVADRSYKMTVRLEPQGGTLVFGAVYLEPVATTPPGGVNTTVWRSLRLGELLDGARRSYFVLMETFAEEFSIEIDAGSWEGRPGPDGHPDEMYAQLALVYLVRVLAGSRHPVQDVAESMRCSPATANTRVAEARRRQLLTPPTTGRAGGALTPRAKALLQIPAYVTIFDLPTANRGAAAVKHVLLEPPF